MIYLAGPYSHPDTDIRRERYEQLTAYAGRLMASGKHVFSPITHSHPIAVTGGLPLDWEYWQEYDRKIMSVCTEMHVLMLPGWKESKGVSAELQLARELDLPIHMDILA